MHIPLKDAPDFPDDWTLSAELRHILEHGSGERARIAFREASGETREFGRDEIVSRATRVAAHLWDLGVRPDDRVALVLPESADFVHAFLGAVWAGFVPVPMFPPLGLGGLDAYAERAAGILEASGARLLVTSGRLQNLLWSLTSRIDSLEAVVDIEDLQKPTRTQPDLEPVDANSALFLQFTSGSTSSPKGVKVTHKSLAANLQAIVRYGLQMDPPNDSAVSWLPLYHDMGLIGMMLGPLLWEIPACYLSPLDFVMYPESWLEAMSDRRATATFAPNFAYALAAKKIPPEVVETLDLSCVRLAGCGGEPIQRKTMEAFIEHFEPAGFRREALLPSYGMAEATLAISFIDVKERYGVETVSPEAYEQERRAVPISADDSDDEHSANHEFVCCGSSFPGHTIKIVDEEGRELGEREVGEIVFDGPSLTAGYFDQPELTAETFSDIGLRTGDLGYLADGELYVTGRKKDLIIVNGRNIDPQTIEWAVADLEGVRAGNVVAFSVPGAISEEIVVVAETKGARDLDDLGRAIRRKVSRELGLGVSRVELVEPAMLPKTSSGKLQRSKARRQYLAGELGNTVRAANRSIDVRAVAKHVARSVANRARHIVRRRTRRLTELLRSVVPDAGR